MAQIIDIISQEYMASSQEDRMNKWIDFFKRYQVMVHKNNKSDIEKPYMTQIRAMPSAKPLLFQNIKNTEVVTDEQEERQGTSIFKLDYEDLVNAKTDIMGLYEFPDKVQEDTKENDNELERKNIDIKILCFQVRFHWTEAVESIGEAVYKILSKSNKKYADKIRTKIFVSLIHFEVTKPIGDVTSPDLDKFVRLIGVIPQFDDQQSIEILKRSYRCNDCKAVVSTTQSRPPRKCPNCEEIPDWTEDPKGRVTQDFTYFVLQERTDRMREGQLVPPTINVSVTGTDFVQSIYQIIEVGMHVAINGIVRLVEISKTNSNIAMVEIELFGIEPIQEETLFNQELKELVEQPLPPDKIDEHYEKLKRSFAPHLEGLEIQKEALLLQSAGSPSLLGEGGTRLRGGINILLFGDVATGKSELLKFQKNVMRKSVYVQGSNATKVGLTASIKQTETLRGGILIKKNSLDAGVYGMIKNGIICFDELHMVASDEHYEAMSTATDDFQCMYIHKNAVHTEIKVDNATLAAANATTNQGKYDVTKGPLEQSNFYHFIWSRMDLKFLHLQKRSDESRHELWKHRSKMQASIVLEQDIINKKDSPYGHRFKKEYNDLDNDYYTQDYLVHEIAYLRRTYFPILRPGSVAWIAMQEFWNYYNQKNMFPFSLKEGEKASFTPMLDERAINSLTRIAQASARLHRRSEVILEDMEIALKLMKESIVMFIPRFDNEEEENRTMAVTGVLMENSLKEALRAATLEQQQKVRIFKQGLGKTMMYIHNMTFNRCTICHGKGFATAGDTEKFVIQHIPCQTCRGARGWYNHFTYYEYEDLCRKATTYVNRETYFNLMKRSGIIKREKMSNVNNMKSALSGHFVATVNLRSSVAQKIFNIVDEAVFLTPRPPNPVITPASNLMGQNQQNNV